MNSSYSQVGKAVNAVRRADVQACREVAGEERGRGGWSWIRATRKRSVVGWLLDICMYVRHSYTQLTCAVHMYTWLWFVTSCRYHFILQPHKKFSSNVHLPTFFKILYHVLYSTYIHGKRLLAQWTETAGTPVEVGWIFSMHWRYLNRTSHYLDDLY